MNNEFSKLPESYWIASTLQTSYPVLTDDINVDIAIVGGGMVGITSAYLLTQEGFKVAVIEADRIIQGTTGHTTAKITSQHGLIYDRIQSEMGEDKAKQYAQANETAISEITRIIQELKIDCDFSNQNAYVYTQQEEYVTKIKNEVNTASNLGIKATFLSDIPLSIPIKGAMCFENQAQFHPRKYLLALAQEVIDRGGYIFEKTRAMDVLQEKPCTILTNHGKKIIAPKVLIASHYPFYEAHGLYFSRIYPERSYILATKISEKFPGGMYITAEDPTRSLRSQINGDEELVLVGGEHHKTGQGKDMNKHYLKLKNFAEQIFTIEDIPYRWSTQDYTTMDEVPYIGHLTSDTPDLLVATGFYKWGMTNSTVAAMIFRDIVIKGKSPWEDVYNPPRITPSASAKNFVVENLDVAKQLITGKILPVPNHIDLKRGEGGIISVDGERLGAYRDIEGKLHLVDTTCTHMGCELQWNSAEKSWDCPCHGSRFTFEGDIITGPALHKLTYSSKE